MTRHKALALMICFTTAFSATQADVTPVKAEEASSSKISSYQYHLIDLGETDINLDGSDKNASNVFLKPAINNDGQVIGNRAQGGFLRDPYIGEWAPYINNVTINFHAITHKGDILVSLNRKSNHTEWMIWPTTTGKNGPRQRIDADAYPDADTKLIFTGLTNDRLAIGNLVQGKHLKPFYWKSNEELHFLKNGDGKVIDGSVKWVNNNNQIAGFFTQNQDAPPGVWSPEEGMQVVRNYRSKPVPDGEAELSDLLIAEDGTVYGTYVIKYKDPNKQTKLIAYAWLPYEGGGFKLLDLDGMSMVALNESHSLVGSLKGQAAICEPGEKPIELSKIIPPHELKDWELIEATSINNHGDLVGYGKFKGEMHIFLAQKGQGANPIAAKNK